MNEHPVTTAGEAPAGADAAHADTGLRHEFTFTGTGAEYFRIWIVNMLLSIITLGIYSAWATVRHRRYLYGNTDLDGHRFDFHGSPIAILRGRLIAVSLFVLYAFGGEFNLLIPIAVAIIGVLGFGWILVKALRFRLSNTSYRNLRFGFRCTVGQAYRALAPILLAAAAGLAVYLWQLGQFADAPAEAFNPGTLFWIAILMPLLLVIVVVPAFAWRVRQLTLNGATYGDERFSAEIRVGKFYGYLMLSVLALLAVGVAVSLLMGAMVLVTGGLGLGSEAGMAGALIVIGLMYLLLIPAYLLPFAVWRVLTVNYAFSQLELRGIRFRMDMDVWAYWWILVSNGIAAIMSIGLLIPWARVRMTRYQLSCLTCTGDLDGFVGSTRGTQQATGDEIGEAFDLDIGF